MNNKEKKKLFINIVFSCLAPVALILIWYIATRFKLVNTIILPSPVKVFKSFIAYILKGKLLKNLLVSIVRVIKGFLVGAILGISLGILMGLSEKLHKILGSLVSIFRPIPMIAWIPLLILWLGIGENCKVAVIVIGTFWPILLNTISGIHSVDKKLLEVGLVREKSNAQILKKIIIPSAWPSIFTGLRLGIGTAWTCVVASEMIAASSGLGYMIMYARELSQPDVVLVGVFTIGLVGVLIDFFIRRIEKRILRWKYINDEK